MNRHLKKAAEYLDRGDGFYQKAADEIIAAQKEDPTLSNRKIGEALGRSEFWVRQLVTWRTSAIPRSQPPFGGEAKDSSRREAEAKRFMREAPPEQVEKVVRSLPREALRNVRVATAKIGQDELRDAEERQRRESPRVTEPSDYYNALGKLGASRRAIVRATGDLRHVNLDDEQREIVLEDVERIEQVLGWLRSYVESGTRSFDSELDALLQGGE